MVTIIQAIQSLRPNAQFVITENDIENIVWHTDDEPLTVEQVTNEVKKLETQEKAKTAARASALAKLAELGLTEEEVKAL